MIRLDQISIDARFDFLKGRSQSRFSIQVVIAVRIPSA
jgi:hypothetical protein